MSRTLLFLLLLLVVPFFLCEYFDTNKKMSQICCGYVYYVICIAYRLKSIFCESCDLRICYIVWLFLNRFFFSFRIKFLLNVMSKLYMCMCCVLLCVYRCLWFIFRIDSVRNSMKPINSQLLSCVLRFAYWNIYAEKKKSGSTERTIFFFFFFHRMTVQRSGLIQLMGLYWAKIIQY